MSALSQNSTREPTPARFRAQKGATLAEVAVVLAFVGVLCSTVGLTLLRQQRFYRGATELLHAREGVRDAIEVLATDIRGMSTADTVRLLADSAIEFFANIGSSIVCHTNGATSVGLPGVASERGNTFTALLMDPDSGDIAVFHRDSALDGIEWERHRIIALVAHPVASACPGLPTFLSGADSLSGAKGFLLNLATPLSGQVRDGAPVRFIRRGRYSLYRGSQGQWYLGYRRCNALGASSCGAIQPLSGPYRDYSSNPGKTGLLFEYFDESGARLLPGGSPLAIARVDVTARAESRQRIVVEGKVTAPADSAAVTIAIRNR